MLRMRILFYYCLIIFLPSFVFVVLSAPSMAYGISLGSILVIIGSKFRIAKKFLNPFVLIPLVLYILFQLIFVFVNNYSTKSLFSLFALILTVLSSSSLAMQIKKVDDEHFIFQIKILSYIILFIGIISLFYKPSFFNYGNYAKSVFPFSEPSHFVISIAPFILFFGFYLNKIGKFVLLLALIFQGIFHPNLTLILLSFLLTGLFFIKKPIQFLILVFCFFLFIYFFLIKLDVLVYFTERLNFTSKSSNLTSLVYMQGWEDAYNSFVETNGLGLGFQKMGSTKPGHFADIIFNIQGNYYMREDGSFLASKLISEFGLLGLFLVILYFRMFIKYSRVLMKFIKLRDINNNFKFLSPKIIFSYCSFVTFSLEIFVRGYGYFSPGLYLFFSAIFVLISSKDVRSKAYV